jgi:hypothetical protein
MARTVLTLLFLLSFSLVPAVFSEAGAQMTDQAYVVSDVKVDTLAESAVIARNKAFGEAQKLAFKTLAARYYSPEEMANFVPPNAQTIAGMVQDFELVNEQFSKKRYIGTYTFRFKANAVNYFFKRPQQYRGDVVQVSRSGLMILPFFQQGGTTVLWDPLKNPWLAAWQKTELAGNPALVLPLGDVSDMMDVQDSQLVTYNAAGLKRMLSRYDARDAAIVVAKFDPANNKDPLVIDIYRTDRRAAELIKTLSVPVGSAKVLSQLLAQAVPVAKEALAGNWKLETIVEDVQSAEQSVTMAPVAKPYTPLAGQVRVQTRFNNIAEWLAIRRSLNTIPALTGVKIVALKANEAVVDLTYSDWPSLNSGLTANGLTISGTGVGNYQLMRQPSATPNPLPYR